MVEQGLLKLAHLVSSLDVIGLISTAGRASDSAGEASKMRAAWVESLHDTQWLSGVQMLLQITLDIVELIRKGDPVLVRSADIGDAVPQVTSLVQVLSNRSIDPWERMHLTHFLSCGCSQLCLDPYYRTIAGFCLLVEKEWMACGTTSTTTISGGWS
jgi:myotubularin-related protein 5/13